MATTSPSSRAIIGEWYQDIVENLYFEVVALDTRSGTVELQYLDGEVGEVDLDTWSEMSLIPASPPEDASAAFEMSMPNSWNDESNLNPCNWNDPLNQIEPDLFQGSDEL
ncbi:hypothetical protein KOI40_15595 [Aestuariicella sp. G3-2]|uniref:DUF6763 family protein n=1 Tax=Pseudomaricurvus albidus TaxID=2842452 RepID=UPI001C0B31F0|nr:DUF6763 family protein [Aestuariicella albida]MBU3071248.1 hypothetical protein [Aestuariicella albida]